MMPSAKSAESAGFAGFAVKISSANSAIARKLIYLAWACVTKDRDFDPNFRQSPLAA